MEYQDTYVRSILDAYFGEYKSNSYDVETTTVTTSVSPDGTVYTDTVTTVSSIIPDGVSGLDVPYVCSVVIFIFFMVFLFRFISSVLRTVFSFQIGK